ncbi:MAG: hypothetical protein EOL87_12565 [Spartobacteria bacterium]|nr:hypothetical protein [Spartobacteria bacterium]
MRTKYKFILGCFWACLVSLSAVFADLDGSQELYSVSSVNAPVSLVLEQLQRQSDVELIFDCDWVSSYRLTASFKNVSLEQALNIVLGGLGYAVVYYVDDADKIVALEVTVAEPDVETAKLVYEQIAQAEEEVTLQQIAEIIREIERQDRENYFAKTSFDIDDKRSLPLSELEQSVEKPERIMIDDGVSIDRAAFEQSVTDHALNVDQSSYMLGDGIKISRDELEASISENEYRRNNLPDADLLFIETDDGDILTMDRAAFQ